MSMTTDNVKYQLEKAEYALRSALFIGYEELAPHRLGNIVEALKEIESAKFCIRYDDTQTKENISITKEEQPDGRVKYEMNNTAFKWNNETRFVPAGSNE